MSPVDPNESPIYVIGTGRSGTTLLRQMLNAHPRVHLTHEASFYVGAARIPRGLDGTGWLELYLRSFSFAWLRIDPEEVLGELPDRRLERAELRLAFNAIMRVKARQYDKPRHGDKTPFHSNHLAAIFRDAPDARVVHIVRDPRATVASLCRMPWSAGSHMLNNWYCKLELDAVRPFAGRVHQLRLEDLLADPEAEMRGVLDFVGEPWDAAVLDHVAHAPAEDVPPFPWLLTATRPRGTSRSSWREQLSPAWVRLIERRNREGMRELGYEPARLEHEPGAGARARALLADLPEASRFLRRFLPLTLRMLSRNPPGAAQAQAALLRLNPDAWRHHPDFDAPCPPNPQRGV